jgi:hypothetical protein
MIPIDLKELNQKCKHARSSIKRLGFVNNNEFENGEILKKADENSKVFKESLLKQAKELKSAREEAFNKQAKLRDAKNALLLAKERSERLNEEVQREKSEKKISEQERQLMRRKNLLQDNISALDKKLSQLNDMPATAAKTLEDLTRQSELFTQRLGIRITKFAEGKLRISMRFIDPKDPEREFSFLVKISDDGDDYQVERVNPPVKNLEGMVEQLNETSDFSHFVRAIRRKFKDTCVHET